MKLRRQELQDKLNEKLVQFECPNNWRLILNERLEIVLVNKLDGKTYNIPKVFSEHKFFLMMILNPSSQ